MLEHGDYIFTVDDYHIYENVADALQAIRSEHGVAPRISMTRRSWTKERPIISGNIRAWRELIAVGSGAAYYFTGLIDPIYTADLISESERISDPRVHQIFYADLTTMTEKLAHQRQTVRFVVDRGISHEFVRHRAFSFAQESTRYCNYSVTRIKNGERKVYACKLFFLIFTMSFCERSRLR